MADLVDHSDAGGVRAFAPLREAGPCSNLLPPIQPRSAVSNNPRVAECQIKRPSLGIRQRLSIESTATRLARPQHLPLNRRNPASHEGAASTAPQDTLATSGGDGTNDPQAPDPAAISFPQPPHRGFKVPEPATGPQGPAAAERRGTPGSPIHSGDVKGLAGPSRSHPPVVATTNPGAPSSTSNRKTGDSSTPAPAHTKAPICVDLTGDDDGSGDEGSDPPASTPAAISSRRNKVPRTVPYIDPTGDDRGEAKNVV